MPEWNNTSIRELEARSIYDFLASHEFRGRVLDYGCGKRPYEGLVRRTTKLYFGFDREGFPANVSGEDIGDDTLLNGVWDTILCTQVIQYVESPLELLESFHFTLDIGGTLVLTYPTCWAEVEPQDLFRFTGQGMKLLLDQAGFTLERHVRRAAINLGGFEVSLGGGVIARA